MDLAGAAIRHIVLPALALKSRSPHLRYLRLLRRSQFWSEAELRAYQWQRLQRVLAHAFARSPFHRERFRSVGLDPAQMSGPEELARLPILTKREVQDNFEHLVVPGLDPSPYEERKTSGSTGTPLRALLDRDAVARKRAAAIRHNEWAGSRPGDYLAVIWGDIPQPRTLRERLRAGVQRWLVLDSQRMSTQSMLAFAESIRQRSVRCLMGQAQPLWHFASFLIERGICDLPIQRVIPTAMVFLPRQRERLQSALGWEVFERYGSEELGMIASECSAHCGLHVCAENLWLEVLPAGTVNPDEGELVVTDLTNYAMPLIRYQIGDVVVPARSACTCGRGLPLLRRVGGRVADCITSPDGYVVSGIAITDHLVNIPGIRQAQVIQEQLDELVIRVVATPAWSDDSRRRLESLIKRIFGDRMRVRYEHVAEIGLDPGSKFRFCVSKVTRTRRS